MSHAELGAIVTVRDGGLVDADVRTHVVSCAACSAELADAVLRSETIRRSLDTLSESDVDVAAAKAAVRARLDERREAEIGREHGLVRALGRAAVLLLLVAGGAYALPGSPIRAWLERAEAPSGVAVPETPPTAASDEGLELGVPSTGLEIALTDVAPDATVSVRWRTDGRALVAAGEGSRYSVSGGRIEARGGSGTIVVALPRTGGPITISVDGRMLLRRSVDGLELPGDVVSNTPEGIVFRTGAR